MFNSIKKDIDLLTGHCPLKRHLAVMGVKNDPTCRDCFYMAEIAMHVLCECEGFLPIGLTTLVTI